MSLAELSDKTLNAFVQQVYAHTGITMDATKRTMLVGRLSRRARRLKLGSLDEYLAVLIRDTSETDAFVDAVTTNKTSMFRSSSIWKHVAHDWLPNRRPTRSGPLRAWSAACSTGQEAASLALLLNNHGQSTPGFSWRVDASDVSPEMVRTASLQRFKRDRTQDDLKRAPGFDATGKFVASGAEHVELSPNLRRHMSFYRHNLFEPSAAGRFDLILARNVIIYFSRVDKSHVIRLLTKQLTPGGLLIVGESESLEHSNFGLDSIAHCIYQKPVPQ